MSPLGFRSSHKFVVPLNRRFIQSIQKPSLCMIRISLCNRSNGMFISGHFLGYIGVLERRRQRGREPIVLRMFNLLNPGEVRCFALLCRIIYAHRITPENCTFSGVYKTNPHGKPRINLRK